MTSSSTAYGAFPDNPEPINEEHPVRGVASFSYARQDRVRTASASSGRSTIPTAG